MQYVWRHDSVENRWISSVEGQPLTAPGSVRCLAESEKQLLIEVTMSGASLPHVHDHDSVGYVVSGRVRMRIDGREHELLSGDGFYHPPGVVHEMEALEVPSVWLEIKSPPIRTWEGGTR